MAPGKQPEQTLPEGQLSRALHFVAHASRDCRTRADRRKRLRRRARLPQQPIFLAHDSPLLCNLPLAFGQSLLLGGEISLPSREAFAFGGELLASRRQLRGLHGGIADRGKRSIAIEPSIRRRSHCRASERIGRAH